MRKFAIATVALLLTGSAYAADLPTKAPLMVPPPPSWSGWYVGINGGGVWGNTDQTISVINNTPAFFNTVNIPTVARVGSTGFKNSGGLAGGQFGYLFRSGGGVMGLEASFDWTNAKGTSNVGGIYPANAPDGFTFARSASTDWLVLLTARAGPDMGSWFPYLTVGAAAAELKYTNTFADPIFAAGCTTCTVSISQVAWGFVAGAGLEWQVVNNWSVRAEYLHIWFASMNGTLTPAPGIPPGTAQMNHAVNFGEDIGRLAISYRF